MATKAQKQEKQYYSSFQTTLLERGVLSEPQLKEVITNAGTEPLERYLVSEQIVSPYDVLLAIAEHFSMPPIVLHQNLIPPKNLLGLASFDMWNRHKALPLMRTGNTLTVALGDPFDLIAQEEIQRITKLDIIPLAALEKEVMEAIARAKASSDSENPTLAMESIMQTAESELEVQSIDDSYESLDHAVESAEAAPVIRIVNMMLVEALRIGASDIHFEALEKKSRLRYRLDGALQERTSPAKALHNSIVSRIKIMANLDIAERRNAQDGRFRVRALNKEVDIRVSILPTIHGEKIVMRILDKTNLAPGLAMLGLDDFAYRAMKHAIDQPHGIILVTGPTGSGKTTTLYSCLQDLNKTDVNIVTAEDPVEYELAGINQVHVNEIVGLTFASVLRSVLRQDPDIVLVGEIRDSETADIAVKAALTGHLVLSTLHTNDAPSVVARLVDMGVPPFLLASSLILAQAQRLFRRLCPVCKKPAEIDQKTLEANEIDPATFEGLTIYDAVGCPKCNGIGYKGRGAIMEVMPISDLVRAEIVKGSAANVIRRIAVEEGMLTLKDVGMAKVRDGITSIRAALEVTGSE